MPVGTVHSARHAPQSARVIGEGAEATVRLDPVRGIVTKVYKTHRGAARALAVAEREYRLLRRLERALRAVPGVDCPAPLELLEDLPAVRMRYVEGVPLNDHVARSRLDGAGLARLARQLAQGLRVYLEMALEPYYDFCLHNALLRPADGGIVLLDFGVPEAQRPLHGRYSDLQLSLGNFLGLVLYEMVRPLRAHSSLARRQLVALYCEMCRELLRGGTLRGSDFAPLEEVARFTYRRLTRPGVALRRAWYLVYPALDAVRLARTRRTLFNPQQ